MRKSFLILMLLLAALSCSEKDKKPANLLSKETMVKVMADMQIAEAKVKNLHLPADTTRKLYSHYELFIFKKYGVDPKAYIESYNYYLDNFNEMQAINNALIDTLTNRQNQIPK